jgi:hypothetical protein
VSASESGARLVKNSREGTAGASPPRIAALRLVGPAADHVRDRIAAPLGARLTADAEAYAVALGTTDASDVASIARALPEPADLPSGTLVFVLPAIIDPPSLTSRFLAAFGRRPTVSRALRSTALVARGYVRVAAGVDRETRSDLVWGYTPDGVTERSAY